MEGIGEHYNESEYSNSTLQILHTFFHLLFLHYIARGYNLMWKGNKPEGEQGKKGKRSREQEYDTGLVMREIKRKDVSVTG